MWNLIRILNAFRGHSAISQEAFKLFCQGFTQFSTEMITYSSHMTFRADSVSHHAPLCMCVTVGRDVSWFPCLRVKMGKGGKNGGDKSRNILAVCVLTLWEDSLDASPEPPVITCTERLIDLIFVHYSHICLSYNRVEWDSQRHCSCITAGSPLCSHGCYVWRS